MTSRLPLKKSQFQPVERDFAFVVDAAVTAESLLRAVSGAEKDHIVDVGIFDTYEGPHVGEMKKSLAVAVTIKPKDSTFTEEQIETISRKIVMAVKKSCGGTLRS